jgi:hypothetical protein
MTQIDTLLKRLEAAPEEHFNFIAGRYKDDPVDSFVTAVSWFTVGVLTGLILAGIIAGITH